MEAAGLWIISSSLNADTTSTLHAEIDNAYAMVISVTRSFHLTKRANPGMNVPVWVNREPAEG